MIQYLRDLYSSEGYEEVVTPLLYDPDLFRTSGHLGNYNENMYRLWTEDAVDFSGEYYTLVDARIYDRPERPVPVYVAAGGPVVAKYAGRAGDGFICTSGKGMELYTDKLLPAVAEGAKAAGRDPAAIDRAIEIKMSYDRDHERALSNCRFWAPLSLTAEQKHSVDSAAEMERLADELPIEQVAQRWIVASDPDAASTTWSSTGRGTTRSGSSASSRRTCCRSCAPSAEPGAGPNPNPQPLELRNFR
jgi:coenzyme F420-dependent glucose-6-phosphate dehydrogenase